MREGSKLVVRVDYSDQVTNPNGRVLWLIAATKVVDQIRYVISEAFLLVIIVELSVRPEDFLSLGLPN